MMRTACRRIAPITSDLTLVSRGHDYPIRLDRSLVESGESDAEAMSGAEAFRGSSESVM
jgi:hypothetical protein